MDVSNASLLLLRFRLRLWCLKHRVVVAAQILWPIVPTRLRHKGSAAARIGSATATSGAATGTCVARIRRIHFARGRTKIVRRNNLGTIVACGMRRGPGLPVVPIQRFQRTDVATFA
jgi:hypothetical protein